MLPGPTERLVKQEPVTGGRVSLSLLFSGGLYLASGVPARPVQTVSQFVR